MEFVNNLLCKIGLHHWQDTRQGPWNGWTQDVDQQCSWCGKRETVTFVNPLSGPRPPIKPHKGR